MHTSPSPRFLRLEEVMRRTGLSKSAIAKAERAGSFPQRVKITPKASAWLESEVSEWITERARTARFTLRGSHAQPWNEQ